MDFTKTSINFTGLKKMPLTGKSTPLTGLFWNEGIVWLVLKVFIKPINILPKGFTYKTLKNNCQGRCNSTVHVTYIATEQAVTPP